jgi:thiol-disulfide isomerase/thioredoxin
VVLLDFFSYGDPAGMAELPALESLAKGYAGVGLSVVGVHIPAYPFERSVEDARLEVLRRGIPWPIAHDGSFDTWRAYENRNLPARFLLDSGGAIRGWHHGAGGLPEVEAGVRTLLREAGETDLPPAVVFPPGLIRPGVLRWRATPEIRFRADAGDDGASTRPEESTLGQHHFEDWPELREEGRAYLRGSWDVGAESITTASEETGLAVVHSSAGVHIVAAAREHASVHVTLNGAPPGPQDAGADLLPEDEIARIPVDDGRVYEVTGSASFGTRNLELTIHGVGVEIHLLHFRTAEVPASG